MRAIYSWVRGKHGGQRVARRWAPAAVPLALVLLSGCGPNGNDNNNDVDASLCTSEQYESAPGVCTALTECASDEYETTAPTATSDRVCTALTVCASDEYESTAPTATSDRVCTALTACASDEYESTAPAATSDRVCTALTVCPAGSYVSTAPTATSDRGCTLCAAESYSATANAETCTDWTDCAAGSYVSTNGTTTTDRACATCTSGTYSTTANAMSCASWTTCPAGTYVSTAGTATSNQACTACASGSYTDAANQTQCTDWSDCVAGSYVSTAGTAGNDRGCTLCSTGTFSDGANQTQCTPWTVCGTNAHEVQAGTSTSDRVCACDTGFDDQNNDGDCLRCASGYYEYPGCEVLGVTDTAPLDGAVDVADSTDVEVTFNTAIDPATLVAQTSPGACTGSFQVSFDDFATCVAMTSAAPVMSGGDSVATYTPDVALLAGFTYKVRISTALEAADGLPLGAPYEMSSGFTVAGGCGAQAVVISQIYGGGGNSGATYDQDFVELHNRSASAVDLTGWSLQYASATGTSWGNQRTVLSGTIPAGGYTLIGLATGSEGAAIPTPDITGSTNLSASNGKLALVRETTALPAEACPSTSTIADFVGYGSANCYETAAAGSPGGNANSLLRGGDGCTDTDDNSADFTVGTVVAPASSATTPVVCFCP